MNSETIHLNMTPKAADSLAYVLMGALQKVTMLPRERDDATDAANALFSQLAYGHCTDNHGNRVELDKLPSLG